MNGLIEWLNTTYRRGEERQGPHSGVWGNLEPDHDPPKALPINAAKKFKWFSVIIVFNCDI